MWVLIPQKKADSMYTFTTAMSRNVYVSDFFIWGLGNGRYDFTITMCDKIGSLSPNIYSLLLP